MTSEPSSQTWQSIVARVRDPDAGLQRIFPDQSQRQSLLDALGDARVAVTPDQLATGQQLQAKLSGLLEQLNVFETISRCPILAITGLLNAGKSSLLATYLSPQNRPRVLRGLGNAAGTHRFVLWLPQVWWHDPDLLNTLVGFMTSLFGHAPEHLADDPQLAAMQYNGHIDPAALMTPTDAERSPSAASTAAVNPLSVPLIAYDAALDDLKLGLIDCPDIQTGFLTSGGIAGAELADQRRQQLARIGRLCSAFIVVSKLNSLHDEGLVQILATLRDAMPGVPRMLAINKIKSRYAPQVVYEQARGLVERFGVEATFAAYDFRSALAHERIPPEPAGMDNGGEAVPVFFELRAPHPLPQAKVSDPSEATAPASLHYLFHLGERLDAGTLSRASSQSLVLQLKSKLAESLEWLDRNQRLRTQQVADAWQAVSAACYEFMAERDASGQAVGLRLQASPAIIAQMADSLQRTAPLWMRFSLSIDRTARQLHTAIGNSASRFKILQSASQSVTQFTKRFRRGEGALVVTPQRLADQLRSCDRHDALQHVPPERLVRNCETAMQRFAAEDQTVLDEQELDVWSRQVWEGMSLKDKLWKGTQPLAVIMAPLLAAVLVPIDGGGTAVLVFASAKELLAAAGIAAVMAPMATGGGALSIVQRETPWRQLSDLFAIVCDSLGVPRPAAEQTPKANCHGELRSLLASKLEAKPNLSTAAVDLWQADANTLRELQIQLQS